MKALARNTFLFLLALLSVTACEKDEDKIYLNSIEPGQLVASDDAVVLTQDRSADIVLSLAWSVDNLAVSDPSVGVPGGLMSMSLEASTDEHFSTAVSTAVSSYSQAYTGFSLNALAQNAGVEPYSPTPVYFRLAARTGSNMEPVYTNTVAVTITSYEIDMSHLYVLDSSQAETGMSLYSPQSDGHYEGFLGVSGWYNFYLQEGDGRVWGAAPIDDNPFTLSEAENKWNLWFPAPDGCYYVVADVNKLYWTALSIPALTLTGDIAGTPEFDRPNNRWTLTFQAAEAGTATIRLSATGSLYNSTTATKDEAAVPTAVSFAQEGDAVVLADQPGDINVSIPAAGECTLILDLSDPTHWTASVQSGAIEEEVAPLAYLPGISDGEISWSFNNYLRLYNRERLAYAGCANVDAPWGFHISLTEWDFENVYTLAEGDADAGTLVFKDENKVGIPTHESGLYFYDVSLKELTYRSVLVESVYYTGLNNDWTLHPMTATDVPGVYEAEILIDSETTNGYRIVLNQENPISLVGSNGVLKYRENEDEPNIDFDNMMRGTFTLSVNLVAGTYNQSLR